LQCSIGKQTVTGVWKLYPIIENASVEYGQCDKKMPLFTPTKPSKKQQFNAKDCRMCEKHNWEQKASTN